MNGAAVTGGLELALALPEAIFHAGGIDAGLVASRRNAVIERGRRISHRGV